MYLLSILERDLQYWLSEMTLKKKNLLCNHACANVHYFEACETTEEIFCFVGLRFFYTLHLQIDIEVPHAQTWPDLEKY